MTHGRDGVQRTRMTNQAIGEHMMSEVLTSLIGITVFWFRRIEQREAHGVIIWFIPTIAGVGEQCNAIITLAVGEICPLMRIHFEEIITVVTAFHTTKADVIGGFGIAHAKRKLSLEQRIQRTPVHFVLKVDSFSQIPLIEMNVLHDVRFAILFLDCQRLAQRTFFRRDFYSIMHR